MTRPNLTQRLALNTNRDRTQWMEVYGYSTYVRELAVIFNINPYTLSQRLNSGWPIEAACLAVPGSTWKIHNIDEFMEAGWVIPMFKATLQRHFGVVK